MSRSIAIAGEKNQEADTWTTATGDGRRVKVSVAAATFGTSNDEVVDTTSPVKRLLAAGASCELACVFLDAFVVAVGVAVHVTPGMSIGEPPPGTRFAFLFCVSII